MEATVLTALPVVLVLELSAGQSPPPLTLSRDEAAELAELMASDIQRLVPDARHARLALAGALFDAVELLRPGFPVWTALDELARRVPRGHLENVVAFGTHEGRMPAPPLQPEAAFANGPMRALPLSLLAPAERADELAEQLEIELVGRGEAGSRTADWLMRTLGVQLEHARYLSRNDLLALTCVQYEHVGLAALWTLLEAALLTPTDDEPALSARGLPLRYAHGKVHARSPSGWLHDLAESTLDRAHQFAGVMFELRQYSALLQAHALPLVLESIAGVESEAGAGYLIEYLAATDPDNDPPTLVAHEAPGLGMVAVTVAQRGEGGHARALAHGYPLQPAALGTVVAALAAHFDVAADLHALGRVVLDANGGLGAPAAPLQ